MSGPKSSLGNGSSGRFDENGITEAQGTQHGKIHFQELREKFALNDETDVGSATLLAVIEAFAQLFGKQRPIGKLPDAVGVDPFHFEHVALFLVVESGGDDAAIGFATDESKAIDEFIADEGIAELTARAADERNGKACTASDSVGESKRIEAAVGGRLGDGGIAGKDLDENRVHKNGHGVIPGSDVGDEAQWGASDEHGRDVFDVPLNARDATVDIRECLSVGLADFPHEKKGDEFAVLLEAGQAFGDAAATLVEIDARPGERFRLGEFYGGERGVQIEHGNAAEAAAVDGGFVMAAETRIFPLAVQEIEDAVFGVECFRRGSTQFFGQRIPLGCRRNDGHAQPPLPNQRVCGL